MDLTRGTWYVCVYIGMVIPKNYIILDLPQLFCHELNLSDTTQVCVKITTGTNKHNDGTLKLTIDGVDTAEDIYETGAVVIDSCFAT